MGRRPIAWGGYKPSDGKGFSQVGRWGDGAGPHRMNHCNFKIAAFEGAKNQPKIKTLVVMSVLDVLHVLRETKFISSINIS